MNNIEIELMKKRIVEIKFNIDFVAELLDNLNELNTPQKSWLSAKMDHIHYTVSEVLLLVSKRCWWCHKKAFLFLRYKKDAWICLQCDKQINNRDFEQIEDIQKEFDFEKETE